MSHNSLIKKYSLIVLIIILSFSTKIFSQDLEKIKNSDTIYIFFKQNFKNQMLYPSNKKDAKAYYESIKVFLEDSLNDNLGKSKLFSDFLLMIFYLTCLIIIILQSQKIKILLIIIKI
ncbi:MAG: hypothetical protein RIQ59_821 [Bacteroidota bacterium]|jgi:hypothetical protein